MQTERRELDPVIVYMMLMVPFALDLFRLCFGLAIHGSGLTPMSLWVAFFGVCTLAITVLVTRSMLFRRDFKLATLLLYAGCVMSMSSAQYIVVRNEY
jgi:hypothetical protein